jgi:sulfite reductase alpha subunit-like flavoprotein
VSLALLLAWVNGMDTRLWERSTPNAAHGTLSLPRLSSPYATEAGRCYLAGSSEQEIQAALAAATDDGRELEAAIAAGTAEAEALAAAIAAELEEAEALRAQLGDLESQNVQQVGSCAVRQVCTHALGPRASCEVTHHPFLLFSAGREGGGQRALPVHCTVVSVRT